METYEAKKHWWFWVLPVGVSLLTVWTIIIPIWYLLWAFLRWKLDKIVIKDGCLQSKMGIIFIDKKTVPLEQISFVSEKQDIISQLLGFACIEINSSAFGKAIEYPCIANPSKFVQFINDTKKALENNTKGA